MPVGAARRAAARVLAAAAVACLPQAAAAQSGAIATALCSVDSTPLNFGPYLGTAPGPTDFTATVTVTCTPVPPADAATVSFSLAFIGSGPQPWQLSSSRGSLRYQLFADSGRSVPLGDGADGSTAITGVGVATQVAPLRRSFTVYGRILARQRMAPAGTYTDMVTLRLSY